MVHGSTFSGIGGPEIAAEMLGWTNAFHCEINPFGRAVLDYHFPKAKSYEDITKTDFSEWRGKIDVLTGGFPCQPFSYAGKRRGSEDDRYLWPFMLRCIEQIQPRWFIGENVAGITTMELPGMPTEVGSQADLFGEGQKIYELRQQLVLNEIVKNLERAGYSVQPLLIPACAVNAPHRRDRVFIIAHREEHATNTNCERQPASRMQDRQERQAMDTERKGEPFDGTARPRSKRATPDTTGEQGNGLRFEQRETRQQKPRQSGGGGSKNGSEQRSSANTSHNGGSGEPNAEGEQMPRPNSGQVGESCKHGRVRWFFGSEAGGSLEALLPEQRWRTFPTVSPVYRGNDGLSFNVDDLTIPFGEWKRESLKAYGNAIVPQVMYEIFRAIEQVEIAMTTKPQKD